MRETLPRIISMGDPIAQGVRQANTVGRDGSLSFSPVDVAAGVGHEKEPMSDGESGSDEDTGVGMPSEDLKDKAEKARDDDVALRDAIDGPAPDVQLVDEAGDVGLVDIAVAVGADGFDGGIMPDAGVISESGDLPPAELVENAVVVGGYVSSTIQPWQGMPAVGRLTTFPDWQPEEKRTVAMRCYMHPGCSVARSRKKVEDHQLLEWLFSMSPPPLSTPRQELKDLRDKHKSMFR